MGFYNESVQIKQLIQDIWNHLKGNESGSVSLYNIKTFLCAIMNFNYPWMKPAQTAEEAQQEENQQPKPKKRVNPAALGVIEDGRYLLTDEEISWIAKYFVLMQYSRQDYVMLNKKQSHLEKSGAANNNGPEFRPQTNPTSKKILEKKNPKNEIGDGKLSYHDYLIQRGRQYKEKHNELAKSKDSQATDGCTFQPQIRKIKKYNVKNEN